jgi:hypothetical protein
VFVKDPTSSLKDIIELRFAMTERMLVVQHMVDDYTQKCVADDLLLVQTQIFTSHDESAPEPEYRAPPLSTIQEAPSINLAPLEIATPRKGSAQPNGALPSSPTPSSANGDTGEEEGDEAKPNCVNGQIHPQAAWRVWWDTILTLFILYSVLSVPYRIGFDDDSSGGWLIFDYTVDIFFGLDIVFAFFTAYIDENDVLVTDRGKIVSGYMKGWFLVDLFSTLPFGLIMDGIGSGASALSKYPKLLRMLRLVRLLKLVRLIKLSKFFKRWEQEGVVNPSILLLVKLLVGILFLSHFFACTWMFIARESTSGSKWFINYGLEDASPDQQYIAAIYWSLTTMTTVGFGDISPSWDNVAEMLFCIMSQVRTTTTVVCRSTTVCPSQLFACLSQLFACLPQLTLLCQLIGVMCFGYIIGSMSSLIANLDKQAAMLKQITRDVNNYMALVAVPKK